MESRKFDFVAVAIVNYYSPRLSQLTVEFQEAFPHPAIPPLPRILATVSTSMSKQTDNHFFASVVGSKEFIPMYHDVILWMLKREMIVALHLRVRLVATSELKARVNEERNRKMLKGFAKRDSLSNPRSTSHDSTVNVEEFSPNSKNATFFLSPKSRFARSRDSDRSGISALDFRGADENEGYSPDSEGDGNSELDEEDSGWDTTEDHVGPSMIDDPGKATPMQRRWLSAMSEGKAFAIARRFEKYIRSFKFRPIGSDCYVLIRINQYFDGKKSDDEILYRAEISRKQLREVLRHYDEYVGTLRITDAFASTADFQCSYKYSYIHRKVQTLYVLPNLRFFAIHTYSRIYMIPTLIKQRFWNSRSNFSSPRNFPALMGIWTPLPILY